MDERIHQDHTDRAERAPPPAICRYLESHFTSEKSIAVLIRKNVSAKPLRVPTVAPLRLNFETTRLKRTVHRYFLDISHMRIVKKTFYISYARTIHKSNRSRKTCKNKLWYFFNNRWTMQKALAASRCKCAWSNPKPTRRIKSSFVYEWSIEFALTSPPYARGHHNYRHRCRITCY